MTHEAAPDAERLEALIAVLMGLDPALSPIGAAIVAACAEGLASDSRSVSNGLGIAHALVLREIHALRAQGILDITRRDARTMRTFYAFATPSC
ncbi:hypothetical protein M673_07590 [Aureimonas sp. AU20]|nr:hypothetical protein M673_07590 [Aureimonas sp. AU20]